MQTAGGTPWPETVLMALLAFALLCLPRAQSNPDWLEVLRSLWNGVILSQVLRWASGYWPETPVWAAGILLLLGLWLAFKGKEAMMAAGSIFGLMQLLLTGGVLLAALPEIRPDHWVPEMPKGNGWLLVALLLPALCQERRHLGPGVWALAISLITTGVMPRGTGGGYYEMSRSISLFGSIRRMEAVAAVGLTLGFLLLTSRLTENGKMGNSLLTAAAAAIIFGLPYEIDGLLAAAGSIIFWIILPSFWNFMVKKHVFSP